MFFAKLLLLTWWSQESELSAFMLWFAKELIAVCKYDLIKMVSSR